jgi:hypothetical protein
VALLGGVINVLLDITERRLNLAEVLLDIALRCQLLVAHELAGGFLDSSFRFFVLKITMNCGTPMNRRSRSVCSRSLGFSPLESTRKHFVASVRSALTSEMTSPISASTPRFELSRVPDRSY